MVAQLLRLISRSEGNREGIYRFPYSITHEQKDHKKSHPSGQLFQLHINKTLLERGHPIFFSFRNGIRSPSFNIVDPGLIGRVST